MTKLIYNKQFYYDQIETSLHSGFAIVPLLMEMLKPKSVVDIGCGVGTWLKAFKYNGVDDILGIDGKYVDYSMLQIPEAKFLGMDLEKLVSPIDRSFDLALCLEVAEHVSELNACKLIDFITTLAPVVFFSAAVPGQGGAGHVNEQWPDYWRDLFYKKGYQIIDVLRLKVWDLANVEPWYCQNSFIYIRQSHLDRFHGLVDCASRTQLPLRLVHPELFRRFTSMEYIQTKSMAIELLSRIRRKVSWKKS